MMLKVSFINNFKKVETFNDKATVVTLTGKILCPNFMSDCLPRKVWEWINHHPSVEVSESFMQSGLYYIIKVSGKSVCADDDTFDAKIGERIAECRTKIRIYKFMQTLTKMLCEYYHGLIFSNDVAINDTDVCSENCLLDANLRYTKLWQHERHHLTELLQKTV